RPNGPRARADGPRGRPAQDGEPAPPYVLSEQSLLAGHPRHPSPKWRSGPPAAWLRYAPELGGRFPMRWLAVAEEAVADCVADGAGFDAHGHVEDLLSGRRPPAGFRVLPVHPWQFSLARADRLAGPALARAFTAGVLVDLGETGRLMYPTASVRTLYQPALDVFHKMSLSVRITNCLRKNAPYELAGAVALTALLAPVSERMAVTHPRFALLPEPASRTVELPSRLGDRAERRAVAEACGVIVRGGLRAHLSDGETALLAGSLIAERPASGAERWHVSRLVGPDGVEDWWASYLALLVDPVLYLWFAHGVALEPHLQNVLVVLDRTGHPSRMLVRDLEGVKIGPGPHAAAVAALPPPVAAAIARGEEPGWNRVAYCLLVNHLIEVLAALADLRPDLERNLWAAVIGRVEAVSRQLGHPDRLVDLLNGAPLPAKANLLLRWSRRPDRDAFYVPFRPNPPAGVPR
ncbi:MAG: IucA/IucC family protein, partial [Frankia sp.]